MWFRVLVGRKERRGFRARYRRALTLDARGFRKGLNSVICDLLMLYLLCDIKIVIFFLYVQKLWIFVFRREECNNFDFDWLCITQFLHFLCSYCIAQFIPLSIFLNAGLSVIFSNPAIVCQPYIKDRFSRAIHSAGRRTYRFVPKVKNFVFVFLFIFFFKH